MEPAEEPPAPEQANEDMEMTDTARPEWAPKASSAAPAAHVSGDCGHIRYVLVMFQY